MNFTYREYTRESLTYVCAVLLGRDVVDGLLSANTFMPAIVRMAVQQAFLTRFEGKDADLLRSAFHDLDTHGYFTFER